ncbi:MAG: hypothetical protein BHW65_06865 [Verrucomicrobia bacterium CAG:312_58_20]|nr:MAG: hypothetical protein BHW65_06865 [Verrucomicrobia bacterium CAG:312_58_20]
MEFSAMSMSRHFSRRTSRGRIPAYNKIAAAAMQFCPPKVFAQTISRLASESVNGLISLSITLRFSISFTGFEESHSRFAANSNIA